LLGVRPELLAERKAFTFQKTVRDSGPRNPWLLLDPLLTGGIGSIQTPSLVDDAIPAIGDANSIQWALGKKIGETIDYTDELGRPFKVRLVGAVANSILQGNLIIDETVFERRFPGESGYRMFLVDVPPARAAAVSATLSRALQDVGLELTPAVDRLNAFNAVQNTYLGTFQVLGGLGLLLGSAGLGVVVLRNVLERRGELAVLVAVGFRRRTLQRLVLSEHAVLLGLGLGIGLVAATVAVLPAVLSPGTQLPYVSLALTLAAVLVNGLIWTWLATLAALRGELLGALRNE
jgi:ABC-type antimicrobial peptide transport system permease subunit